MKVHRIIVDFYVENDDQTDDLDILEILAAWHKRGMDRDQSEFGTRWPISILLEHKSVRYSRTLPQEAIDEREVNNLPRGAGVRDGDIPHRGGPEGVYRRGIAQRLGDLFVGGNARRVRRPVEVEGRDDVITCLPDEHLFDISKTSELPLKCLCGKTEIANQIGTCLSLLREIANGEAKSQETGQERRIQGSAPTYGYTGEAGER